MASIVETSGYLHNCMNLLNSYAFMNINPQHPQEDATA